MNRILLAFRCFFEILFHGALSADALGALKLARREPAAPGGVPSGPGTPPAAPSRTPADGALQILTILQRDSRVVDFLMEDIASYSDDQVGAAVRELHDQCRDSLARHFTLQPVIDGVEGTPVKAPSGCRRDTCSPAVRDGPVPLYLTRSAGSLSATPSLVGLSDMYATKPVTRTTRTTQTGPAPRPSPPRACEVASQSASPAASAQVTR